MNACDATLEALTQESGIPAAVREHARVCPGCATLLRSDHVLTHQGEPQVPDMAPALRLAVEQGGAVRAFSPWRAVMPWALTACVLTAFGIMKAHHVWDGAQVTALITLCLATAVAGVLLVSRGPSGLGVRDATRWGAVACTFVVLELALALVVDVAEHPDEAFWMHNMGCLRAGLMASVVCAIPLAWALRRSASASPASTGALLGAASALPALAMITLSCPVRESLHLLVFHAAVVALGIAVGLVAGRRVVTP